MRTRMTWMVAAAGIMGLVLGLGGAADLSKVSKPEESQDPVRAIVQEATALRVKYMDDLKACPEGGAVRSQELLDMLWKYLPKHQALESKAAQVFSADRGRPSWHAYLYLRHETNKVLNQIMFVATGDEKYLKEAEMEGMAGRDHLKRTSPPAATVPPEEPRQEPRTQQ